jgi:hypothetical protein
MQHDAEFAKGLNAYRTFDHSCQFYPAKRLGRIFEDRLHNTAGLVLAKPRPQNIVRFRHKVARDSPQPMFYGWRVFFYGEASKASSKFERFHRQITVWWNNLHRDDRRHGIVRLTRASLIAFTYDRARGLAPNLRIERSPWSPRSSRTRLNRPVTTRSFTIRVGRQ